MVLKIFKTTLPIIIILLVSSCVPKGGRSFYWEVEYLGWKMEMHETDSNRVLDFRLQKSDNLDATPICIKLRNGGEQTILTFIIVDGVDSVYVRYDRESFEDPHLAVPPPNMPPERRCNVIGEMPSKCVKIPYSDKRFVVYNEKGHEYYPIADSIHIINIYHATERANHYEICHRTPTNYQSIIRLE